MDAGVRDVTSFADAPKTLYINQDFGRSLYLTEYTAAHVWQPIRGRPRHNERHPRSVRRLRIDAVSAATVGRWAPAGSRTPNPRQAGSGRERSLGARLVRLLLDVRGLDSREFDLCGGPSPAPAHDEFESMATWARSRQERVDGVRRVLPIDEPTHPPAEHRQVRGDRSRPHRDACCFQRRASGRRAG